MAEADPNANTQIRQLAYFVKEVVYKNWSQNRALVETKWQRNYEAFHRIKTGLWKVLWKKNEGKGWRSDTFLSATKQKVMACYSLLQDMVLLGGKIPFGLKATRADEEILANEPPETRKAVEDETGKMKNRLEEQLAMCKADRALTKNILSLASYGETWAKYIVRDFVRPRFVPREIEGIEDTSRMRGNARSWRRREEHEDIHSWEHISVWDMFWDMENPDLRANGGQMQRALLSPYELRQKIGDDYYIDDAIKKVLGVARATNEKAAPESVSSLPPYLRDVTHRDKTILYLELWGRVPREIADKFEKDERTKHPDQDLPDVVLDKSIAEGDEVEVMVCTATAGDITEVVRYARTEPQERPFFRTLCEETLDKTEGIGVADNVEELQGVLNGAMRAFEDNKKLACDVIAAVKPRMLRHMPNGIEPGKLMILAEEAKSARDAFQQVVIQDVGQSLLSLFDIVDKFIDEDSMIPKIQQGIVVRGKETAYEVSQRLEKGSKYIGAIIRNIDEGLIEPIVGRFYAENMEDPAIEEGKGDYVVTPLGFSSFQDRVARMTKVQQFLALCLSDDGLKAEANLRGFLEELAKMSDVDPDQFLKSDEQKKAEIEREAAIQQAMQELDMAQQQAEVQKTEVETAAIAAEAQRKDDELAMKEGEAEKAPAT